MAKRGEIFSTSCKREKRTYFFNVHENFNKSLSLSIVESQNSKDGSFNRQSILVYNEDLDDFLKELSKSVDFLRMAKASAGKREGFESREPDFKKRASFSEKEKTDKRKRNFSKREEDFKKDRFSDKKVLRAKREKSGK